MAKRPAGFVPLTSLKATRLDPAAALAAIRRIYFETTKRTIDHDLLHALELLRSLPDEETRERASVYMEGLSQMQRDWEAQRRKRARPARLKPDPTSRRRR
jgi:hypothetical protein